MSEPLWLDLSELIKIHEEQIEAFGGPSGIRDIGLVESALARPQQLFFYEGEEDVLTLAVRLGPSTSSGQAGLRAIMAFWTATSGRARAR